MITRRSLLFGSAAAVAGLSACSAEPVEPGPSPSLSTSPAEPTATPPEPSATASPDPSASGSPRPRLAGTIADGLDVPWGIAFLPSGAALVSERNTARLRLVTPAGKVTTIGEVDGVVAPSGFGEGGLLGIALAPDDEDTLFAYITTADDNRVVRLSLADGRVGRPRAVLPGIPSSTHHHGGRLLFAADGTLFVSTGDAGQSGLAQDRGSLAGKILRIDPDGSAAAGNPYGNRTWTYGHRNVEGLAFDADGRLWATEFGEKESDELNLLTKGGNYGWPRVEGDSDDDRFVAPSLVWSPTSIASPAGLAITRETAFVGALQGRCMFAVPLDGRQAGRSRRHLTGHGRIRSVAVAPDGALWVTTSNTDGRTDPGPDDDLIMRVTL